MVDDLPLSSVQRLNKQWSDVRAIAHRRSPVEQPNMLFDIISQMPTEQAFDAVEYVRQVRGFAEGWGLYEIELLGLLESFIGRSVWATEEDDYGLFLEMSQSTQDALGIGEVTLRSWGSEHLSRGVFACGPNQIPPQKLERGVFGVPVLHRHELANDGHLVYGYCSHGKNDSIYEPLRCWGRYFTTKYYEWYVLGLDEAIERFGSARADAVRYLWRTRGKGQLFDTLQRALQLPDSWSPEYLLGQDASAEAGFGARVMYDDARALWLSQVRDPTLREHLSNFIHTVPGDRHPLSLVCHPVWQDTRAMGTSPIELEALTCQQTQRHASVLLAWTCEYFDTLDKVALVQWCAERR